MPTLTLADLDSLDEDECYRAVGKYLGDLNHNPRIIQIPNQKTLWAFLLSRRFGAKKVVLTDSESLPDLICSHYDMSGVTFLNCENAISKYKRGDLYIYLSQKNAARMEIELVKKEKGARKFNVLMSENKIKVMGHGIRIFINREIHSLVDPTVLAVDKSWFWHPKELKPVDRDLFDVYYCEIQDPQLTKRRIAKLNLEFPQVVFWPETDLAGYQEMYCLSEEQCEQLQIKECGICDEENQICVLSCCHHIVCTRCLAKIVISSNPKCPYCRSCAFQPHLLCESPKPMPPVLIDLQMNLAQIPRSKIIIFNDMLQPREIVMRNGIIDWLLPAKEISATHIICPLQQVNALQEVKNLGNSKLQLILYTHANDAYRYMVSGCSNYHSKLSQLQFHANEMVYEISNFRNLVHHDSNQEKLCNAIIWCQLNHYENIQVVDDRVIWNRRIMIRKIHDELLGCGIKARIIPGLGTWKKDGHDHEIDTQCLYLAKQKYLLDLLYLQCLLDSEITDYSFKCEDSEDLSDSTSSDIEESSEY